MDGRFTDEELAIAKSVDLCAVAESLGYTVKRIGKYHTLKEMDSIRIYLSLIHILYLRDTGTICVY